MLRITSIAAGTAGTPADMAVMTHEERHLRRRVIRVASGRELLVDLPSPVVLAHGDRLVLEDGRHVEVIAAEQDLLEVRAASPLKLLEVAWHLGNRHVPAQIEPERILIERDHVLADLLSGLGASVREVREPFHPARGAYHRHGAAGHAHQDHASP